MKAKPLDHVQDVIDQVSLRFHTVCVIYTSSKKNVINIQYKTITSEEDDPGPVFSLKVFNAPKVITEFTSSNKILFQSSIVVPQ